MNGAKLEIAYPKSEEGPDGTAADLIRASGSKSQEQTLTRTTIKCHNRIISDVIYEPAAWAQFEQLPGRIKARVSKIVERLAKWPEVSGAKPLRGDLTGRFRIRSGDYRIQFHVRGDKVFIEKIGHRDGFYEG